MLARILRRLANDTKPAAPPLETSLCAALSRLAKRGIRIATVIDVGASDGRWSAAAEEFWPDARYHLIEAFSHWKPTLDALVERKPSYSFTLAAAGECAGETDFFNSEADPLGGAALKLPGAWKVPMVAIDDEVARRGLPLPYLVKLDTHGTEREILAGARETLKGTALLINEFYNFQSEERRWPQMVALIESMGFRCVDMIEPLWRPKDGMLWQMDFAFTREDLTGGFH